MPDDKQEQVQRACIALLGRGWGKLRECGRERERRKEDKKG